jgi:SAM-dependent methyltransferase
LLHLCRFSEIEGEAPKGRPRSAGWTVDALLPYLLRDWTGTRELEDAGARIGAALKRVLPAPSGKSVVFAACGAGGLLGELPPEFDRVLGFDLTLPVLAAARCLLDGGSLELALPRAINKIGSATLRRRESRSSGSFIALAAMDAFNTAFANDSIDCVVTSFLLDLVSDPHAVANEIHRILSHGGVWINYGPSGPLKALLRFDEIETPAFIEANGFAVVAADAFRATYLDLSRDCPTWSFQSHICYLTTARKAGASQRCAKAEGPDLADIPALVPEHFPGATLIERQSLETGRRRTVLLRHERIPGRPKNLELSPEAAQIMALVDGKRTVSEIAALLQTNGSAQPPDEIIRAFTRYFEEGLIGWRRSV